MPTNIHYHKLKCIDLSYSNILLIQYNCHTVCMCVYVCGVSGICVCVCACVGDLYIFPEDQASNWNTMEHLLYLRTFNNKC